MLGRAVNSAEFATSRVRKTVGSATTKYIYAGSQLLFTTDGNNVKLTETIVAPNGEIIASQRFSGNYEDEYYFYNADIRGSTTTIISDSYFPMKYYTYNEYGKLGVGGYSSFINEVTYTGAVGEGGNVYYMNARFYDANNGRFLTQDTYKGNMYEPMSQNLYTYVGNNPVNYVDPTGHTQEWSSGGIRATEYSDPGIVPVSGTPLDYNPEYWNDGYSGKKLDKAIEEARSTKKPVDLGSGGKVQYGSNCYGYACLNKSTENGWDGITHYQPGEILGQQFNVLEDWNIELFAQYDAKKLGGVFKEIDQYDILPSNSYKVALVLSNSDYHWYRQNSDGTWSHKPGISPVTNLDASGNLIYNPEFADRDYSSNDGQNYDTFVGYYMVTSYN